MPLLRAILTAALLLSLVPHAYSGDTATVEILGFNADGRIFAFEEYGVQDGSGFAYANRYYIDTDSDSFLPNTPIRVRLEDEQATPAAARAEAKTRSQAIISDELLNLGFQAGWNSVTELSADPHRMMVNPRPVMPPLDAPLEFRLEEIRLEQPESCRDLGDIVGFRLLRMASVAGEETMLVHEDESIPQSRRCPLSYRIAGIQTYFPADAEPTFAVLIAVRSFGFEGPDHRFIAVTGQF